MLQDARRPEGSNLAPHAVAPSQSPAYQFVPDGTLRPWKRTVPAQDKDLQADQAPGGLLRASRTELALKRTIDIAGSLIALSLLLWVMVLAALAVKLTSKGPVFYAQERVGRNGRPFRILKLRSMYVDAEPRRREFDSLNEAAGPVFKMRHDPRVTRVGRVLRKLSIDELPQLLNVLMGEMSLVGPRPPLPAEVQAYGPHERERLRATPGLTCIWQVSGRSDIGFHEWVELDLDYIERWSLLLDLRLLLLTIPAVMSGRGAY